MNIQEKHTLEVLLTCVTGYLNQVSQNRPKLKDGDYDKLAEEGTDHQKAVDGLRDSVFQALKILGEATLEENS